MFEIELKAHVDDREKVMESLNSFADYLQSVQKDDVYWAVHKDGRKIQTRIRKEVDLDSGVSKIYMTYKRKERRIAENGNALEVNDERECEISDSDALETLLKDAGFVVALEKHKSVMGWRFGECHIELCAVPPLGDFLEIEVMSEKDDEKTAEEKKLKIMEIFNRCGIGEEKIENRYYSEMLAEIKSAVE